MKTKKLSKTISKITADAGMKLTQYVDGVGDLHMYAGYDVVVALNSICATYHEITTAQHEEYLEAKAALEASEDIGDGEGEGND